MAFGAQIGRVRTSFSPMLETDRPAPIAVPRDIDYIRVGEPAPIVLAYRIGVDSTALLVELESRSPSSSPPARFPNRAPGGPPGYGRPAMALDR